MSDKNIWKDGLGLLGKKTHVVECRMSGGTAVGGSLAFPGTFSQAMNPDVVVVAMSASSRHITCPVCQITYALREAELEVSVLILASGTGSAAEASPTNTLGSSIMSLSDLEAEIISRHKIAIIHVGNVPSHFIPKIKEILRRTEVKAIIISQAPIDFDVLSLNGIRTTIDPMKIETRGMVIDFIHDVVRGQRCTQSKINEIVGKTKYALDNLESNSCRDL